MIMTSNLGAREMSELISGGIGFAPGNGTQILFHLKLIRKFTARRSKRHGVSFRRSS